MPSLFCIDITKRCRIISCVIHGSYEWDDAKAAANFAKHGLAFEVAVLAFADPQALRIPDRRRDYGEDRFNLFGRIPLDGVAVIIVVCYVARHRIRLISARFANRREIARLPVE